MINEYEVLMRVRTDRNQFERKLRDAQFVEDALGIEKAQPKRLRFHLHLPHFSGLRLFRFFRLRRQPRCTHEPLSAR